MIRALGLIAVFLTLASCGADGMPSKPEPKAQTFEPSGPVDMMGAAS